MEDKWPTSLARGKVVREGGRSYNGGDEVDKRDKEKRGCHDAENAPAQQWQAWMRWKTRRNDVLVFPAQEITIGQQLNDQSKRRENPPDQDERKNHDVHQKR